jgi:UDP-N-acetylglucosamine 4,6-dehydratase/5-epimerase
MLSIDEQCPKLGNVQGERILIFGGSGSLGKATISRWVYDNTIVNVSRDEEKQWLLKTTINHPNLSQQIGDITIMDDVTHAILTTKPTIICIFACLKHIDLCEKCPAKSMSNNTQGIMNVESVLMRHPTRVKTVLFVSTDKACLPITTYGCSKALAEFFLQQVVSDQTKWVGVRYGNVLNSSGSILPYLHAHKHTPNPYSLTHPDMTRFIMTLDHSINLIEYAITHGKHNEIIIPTLASMRIEDLFKVFEARYGKTHAITGLRCKEKIHEDLISVSEAELTYRQGAYYHIGHTPNAEHVEAFDSSDSLISKDDLEAYLLTKNLL